MKDNEKEGGDYRSTGVDKNKFEPLEEITV